MLIVTAADLRKAIRCGELLLEYQPCVSVPDTRITGFEALVRWNHPFHGFLYPSEFIHAIERGGLEILLGRWILREALRQMAEWRRDLRTGDSLTMSVNTTFRYMTNPGLIADVDRFLAESAVRPQSLRLELTENAVIREGYHAWHELQVVKAMGVGLVVDNFGTGHGPVGYLRDLPFDALKIDRSLIRELGTRDDSSSIIHSILTTVGSIGMTVTAAGVETPEQLRDLTNLGCDRCQGSYFAGPLAAADAGELMRLKAARRNPGPSSIHLI